MKFEDLHRYWKHDNCLDVFFAISSVVSDDGIKAELFGCWCTQGIDNWWFTIDDRIKIKPEQYDSWKGYTPKGIVKL